VEAVHELKMEELYEDTDMNCRGAIVPIDVVDLCKSIERNGLLQPITVQPYTKPDDPKIKYRIIVGHRRYTAFRVLKRESIPALIKIGLSEVQARVLNLQENLERQDLNILQEAKSIYKFKEAGYTMQEVAKLLNVSIGWVQVRYNLLSLEPEIQAEAARGFLTQGHIKQLYAMPDRETRFEAVKKIKESKLRGEKKAINIATPKKRNPLIRKPRQREEIFDMIGFIIDILGSSFSTRALAWAAGEISDLELYRDMKVEAEALGKLFSIPNERLVGARVS